MLIEFQGAINSTGLCSLQQVSHCVEHHDCSASPTEKIIFWAVLEAESATRIIRELMIGSNRRAMQLLEELAVSMGSQPNQ